jgi:alkanesulfonate monooxygenase SsuD/methylene tetrahydromethanopterin reductase-like flavin-dependent oxidoreductase (luciferase family)
VFARPAWRGTQNNAIYDVCCALTVFGIDLPDPTLEAFLFYAQQCRDHGLTIADKSGTWAGRAAWTVLHEMGVFPASTPETLRAAVTRGQQSVADLVDRHSIRNREIRDLLVDYITRRAVELDYSTLPQLVRSLVGLFWRTVEKLNPDQADLRLSERVVQGWKESLLVRPDGKPRLHIDQPFMVVRALYLDIQSWAAAEPERWAHWVAPCPVRDTDLRWFHQRCRRNQERIAQRTCERQPLMPILSASVNDRWHQARELLQDIRRDRHRRRQPCPHPLPEPRDDRPRHPRTTPTSRPQLPRDQALQRPREPVRSRRVMMGIMLDTTRPPLSILDLVPVPLGRTSSDALANSMDLARVAERTGYRRFWVAEHHLVPGLASSSAPVVVALLASATERIRVGSGAVLIPVTSPLQAVEQMGTVAAVHPGRVDFGLGRFDLQKVLEVQRMIREGKAVGGPSAPPQESRVVDGLVVPARARFAGAPGTRALLGELLGFSADDAPTDYGEQIDAIAGYLAGTARRPDGGPLTVLPAEGADLDLWVLGSSPGSSAAVAGQRGLPFAVAYHVFPSGVLDTVEAYRAAFRPSRRLAAPYVMVSADVVVADTDEEAAELAAPYAQWVLDIRSGRGALPYVTPAQARARVWTEEERAVVADRVATQFVGSPDTVTEKLMTLARVTGADELIVTTITTDHADRVRSTELLAKAWLESPA